MFTYKPKDVSNNSPLWMVLGLTGLARQETADDRHQAYLKTLSKKTQENYARMNKLKKSYEVGLDSHLEERAKEEREKARADINAAAEKREAALKVSRAAERKKYAALSFAGKMKGKFSADLVIWTILYGMLYYLVNRSWIFKPVFEFITSLPYVGPVIAFSLRSFTIFCLLVSITMIFHTDDYKVGEYFAKYTLFGMPILLSYFTEPFSFESTCTIGACALLHLLISLLGDCGVFAQVPIKED